MKHTLEVPLLPDGWKPVRVGYVEPGEWSWANHIITIKEYGNE